MNYKLLILFALIASVLLSGCVGSPVNPTDTPNATIIQKQNIQSPINQGSYYVEINGIGSALYIFHVSDNGHAYTCFYMYGGGLQVNPALSCTRDFQAVV